MLLGFNDHTLEEKPAGRTTAKILSLETPISCSSIDFKAANLFVSQAEIDEEFEKFPHEILLTLFRNDKENGELFGLEKDTIHVASNEACFKIGIQIRAKNKSLICFRPSVGSTGNKDLMYKVGVEYKNPENNRSKKYKLATELNRFDPDKEKTESEYSFLDDVTTSKADLKSINNKTILKKSFYSFYSMKFNEPGTQLLRVDIISPTDKSSGSQYSVLSKDFKLVVQEPPVDSIRLNNMVGTVNILSALTFRIGKYLPPMSISFCDKNGDVVCYTGQYKVEIASNCFEVVFDYANIPKGKEVQFDMEFGENGTFEFEDQCMPEITGPIMEVDRVTSSFPVVFTLTVSVPKKVMQGDFQTCDQIIGIKEFELDFRPG